MATPMLHSELIAAAIAAAEHSHSPYSGFRVGAAVATADGGIVCGTNIESASYGLTCCAERVAMFSTIAAGHGRGTALAVACPDVATTDVEAHPNSVMPCGACRQVMSELLEPEATIIVVGVGEFRIGDLLPAAFTLDH